MHSRTTNRQKRKMKSKQHLSPHKKKTLDTLIFLYVYFSSIQSLYPNLSFKAIIILKLTSWIVPLSNLASGYRLMYLFLLSVMSDRACISLYILDPCSCNGITGYLILIEPTPGIFLVMILIPLGTTCLNTNSICAVSSHV